MMKTFEELMMKNVKKLLPISLFLVAAVCADQPGQSKQGQPKQETSSIAEMNLQDKMQPISANHGTDRGFYIDGSYLYWKADMDNLAYAATTTQTGSAATGFTVKSRNENMDFEWNSGGQLEIGYIFDDRQGWKAGASATHYKGHAHGTTTADDFAPMSNFLISGWYAPLNGQNLSKAHAHWDLNFNTLDLTLGRDFYVSKWLSFSPYFGMQGAWIKQEYKANYTGGFNMLPSTFVSNNSKVKFENHFSGYGFEFGTGFIFHIIKNFGIVGNIQGSMLWGYIRTTQKGKGAIPNLIGSVPGLTPETIKTVDKKHRLRTNIQSELGFLWEMFWNENYNRFYLSAMYTYSVWFNQQEFKNVGFSANQIAATNLTATNYAFNESAPGDLQLQGLVIKAGFDF